MQVSLFPLRMIYTCIVPNCGNTSEQWTMIPFPKPARIEIYNIWLERIEGPDKKSEVLSSTAQQNVVCENHFSIYCRIEDRYGNLSLKKGSLPTIDVPGFSGESTAENSILKRKFWTNIVNKTKVANYEKLDYTELEKLDLLEECMLCRTKEESLKYYNVATAKLKRRESFLTLLEGIVDTPIDVKTIHTVCSKCRAIVSEFYDAKRRQMQIQEILLGYIKNEEILSENSVKSAVKREEAEIHIEHSDDNEEVSLAEHYEDTHALSVLEVDIKEDEKSDSDGITDDFEELINSRKPRKYVRKKMKTRKIEDTQTQCDVCHKKFARNSTLKQHMSIHGPNKPFVCEVCGKVYRHKGALKIHLGMHNGVHPFTCEYCKKSFTQKIALLRHIPMHTGETPHVCDLCGKRFIHRTSFRIHKLNHAGKKDHKCSVCNFAFLSRSHLNRHLKRHTGEKNFACHVCGRRFAERYNLMCHQKMHASQDLEKPPEVSEIFKFEIVSNSNSSVKTEHHNIMEHP